jgi:hypothetical protein
MANNRTEPERAIAIDAERITAGPETPSEAITDLLADIRHYCDTYDLDYAELDRVAYGHYLEERGSR